MAGCQDSTTTGLQFHEGSIRAQPFCTVYVARWTCSTFLAGRSRPSSSTPAPLGTSHHPCLSALVVFAVASFLLSTCCTLHPCVHLPGPAGGFLPATDLGNKNCSWLVFFSSAPMVPSLLQRSTSTMSRRIHLTLDCEDSGVRTGTRAIFRDNWL